MSVRGDLVSLRSMLGDRWHVDIVESCNSTMDEAKLLLKLHDRVAFCSHTQLDGRGRRGNKWTSPPGGVYATFAFRFPGSLDRCAGLSLAYGVSILESRYFLDSRCGLKWPNDIIHTATRRKVGGILIELISGEYGCGAMMGVGINRVHQSEITEGISLEEITGEVAPYAQIISDLALAAEKSLTQCVLGGFPQFRDRWLQNTVHRGGRIAISTGEGEIVHGDFVGVDSTGALQIADGGQLHTLHAGHIEEW